MENNFASKLKAIAVGVACFFLAAKPAFAQDINWVLQHYLGSLGIGWGPSCSTTSLSGIFCILAKVINYLLTGAGIVSVIFLSLGGIQYTLSGGDEKALANAKATITSAIAGLFLVAGAIFIVNFVLGRLL